MVMNMKLNNNGWGLPHLLAGIAVIVIFLIIAAFFTLRLDSELRKSGINSNISKTSDNTDTVINSDATPYYVEKITSFTSAADKYITNENIVLEKNSYQRIELATLVYYGYLNDITDYDTNNTCKGYALADLDTNDIKEIKVYLKCDNYTSKGYGE